jgi:hypothetical protein
MSPSEQLSSAEPPVPPARSSLVRLVITAPPGTDIFVIDSQFRALAHEGRRLDLQLMPGIYKVKFQAGSAVHEQHVVLEPGASVVELKAPPLAFQSSVPLAGTETTHDYHMANAATFSRQVHLKDGAGASVFVFARNWTDTAGSDRNLPLPRGQHPATGLALHDADGRLVADLTQTGNADLGAQDPWSACTVEVKPGPYRLRVQVPEIGTLEQIVIAPPGWQAQVFLLQTNYGGAQSPVYRADLTRASMLLARLGAGFDPNSDSLQLTELARAALRRRRVVVARDLLDQLLESKFENPMLGLYAAHALLANTDPDRLLLHTVLQHLRGMLGPHPDVDALALYLGEQVGRTYSMPPMLRRSWSIVVEHAARRRDLVPAGSFASRAGSAIWGNSIWLIWEMEALDEPAEDAPVLEEAVLKVEGIAASVTTPDGQVSTNVNLDDIEQSLLSYVTRRVNFRNRRANQPQEQVLAVESAGLVGEGSATAAAVPAPSPPIVDPSHITEMTSRMAEDLGLPPSTVQRKMGGLLRKLNLKP